MSPRIYHFGVYRLIPATRELWRGEERAVVPARVFACLEYLLEQRERAVGRAELIHAIWHRDNVSDIRLGQLVLLARRAVGDEGNSQHAIRTVVGFGYHWIAPTRCEEDDVAPPPATQPPAVLATVAAGAPAPPAEPCPLLHGDHAAARPQRWRRAAVAAAFLLTIAATAAAVRLWRGAAHDVAVDTAEARVLVRPLEVSGDGDVAWARLGGMDLVAERLRRGGLSVVPSETALGVLRDGAGGGRARALAGASIEVQGRLTPSGRRWTARLEASLAAGERLRAEADADEPVEALRRASDALLARFGRAPSADASSPQTADVLQRVRAALLADDPARARAIVEAIADPAVRAAPEVRLTAAQIDARGGRFAQALAALDALLPSIGTSDNPRLRMRALDARGLARLRIGRLTEARADFDAALALPAAETFRPEYADALNGRGIVAVALHEDDAASFLGGARLQFDRDGDALGVARVDVNLGLADYERGAFAQASTRLQRSLAVFADLGAVRELSSALGAQMTVQSSQLQNEAALATSDRFWAMLERAGDPAQRRATTLRRAAALAAVGRLREAHALLERIRAEAAPNLAETRDAERLQLLETDLALREGRGEEAARAAASLPSEPLPFGDDDLRATAALLRQRAIAGAGVEDLPARLDAIAAAPRTAASPLRALALAEQAARADRDDLAARAYRLALSQAETGGVPRVITTVAASYVPWLIGQQHAAEAAAVVGRLGDWAERDFDCAMLRLLVADAQDDPGFRRDALAAVQRLAGERPIEPASVVGTHAAAKQAGADVRSAATAPRSVPR
jgi:DNA-binding winged helix-turn-helix (wHTH) protein/tetratricopeptide (TPR) repeat protein